MAWRTAPGSYRQWVCACGRYGLADALDTCPGCGAAKPGATPPAAQAAAPKPAAPARARPAAVPRPARKRTRTTRTAKGG